MPLEDLPRKVKDLLTNKLDKTVYVKADARAKYEAVEDVVDNLRAAGVDQLGLLTEQIQEQDVRTARPQAGNAGAVVVSGIEFKENSLWQWQWVVARRRRSATST